MIIPDYLPGALNVEADHQSQSVTDSSKRKLNPLIFKKISKVFGLRTYTFLPRYYLIKYQHTQLGNQAHSAKERMFFNYLRGISRDTSLPPFVTQDGFWKKLNGKRYNDFDNSSMAGATMVTKETSNQHSQSSLNPKGK